MFEVLTLLRDLNAIRPIQWDIAESDSGREHLVVRIPIDTDDRKVITDLRALLGVDGDSSTHIPHDG
ncbi:MULTISPECIES: hypothetical protein [Promicromonospora]|uniref:ACT domain-containing protein n=2 Tax=Promicromonospora TaxID=43676 RepID=A0ABW4V691_9MICO